MLKELIFKLKIKKLDKMHIKQYLERKGYELIHLNTEQGKRLAEKLKVKISDDDSIIYNAGKFRYVFIGQTSNEADELMLLLHECGHIEHKHKSISKYNEAEAWHFAYSTALLPQKILKQIIAMLLPAALIFALMQSKVSNTVPATSPGYIQPEAVTNSAADSPKNENSNSDNREATTSDTVYVTRTGTRFHLADCYTINGKDTVPYSRSEAEKYYTPCKICRP